MRPRIMLREMTRTLPELPSVFAPLALREDEDAFARAIALAPGHGAGTLAWASGPAHLQAAVVLEPEMPLAAARLAQHAAANALADALAALGPPEVAIGLRWPATLLVNGAACGSLRTAAPPGTPEDAVPDWLVIGMSLTLALPAGAEPGRDPGRTALAEEAMGDLPVPEIVAAWARHLMAGLDDWASRGPRRLSENFLARLEDGAGESGLRRGIDPATAALVLDRHGLRETRPLV